MRKSNSCFLRMSQVQAIVPYSVSHLWRLERAGEFPKRVQIGANRVGWVADEIDQWVLVDNKNQSSRLGRPDDKISDVYRTPMPK